MKKSPPFAHISVQGVKHQPVGALYENREALTERPLSDNPLYQRLLAPLRKVGV